MNERFTPHIADLSLNTNISGKPLSLSKSTESKKEVRESSMELLRIVAMSMIVIHHFLVHGVTPDNFTNGLYYILDPFFLIGVNLFFLISGYFQVKYSLKSILRLSLLLLFFGLINQLLLLQFTGSCSTKELIRLFLFPISSSQYWFIAVYLILLIISPILNYFIKNLSIAQYQKFLIVFSFVIFYNCGIGYNYTNHYGSSLLQCVYLYFVASFIRLNKDFLKNWNKYSFLMIYIIATLANCVCSYYTPTTPYFRKYDGIFVLISSFALFIFFTRIKFQNQIVNSIATAALGCYLLQDGSFGRGYFYPYMTDIYLNAPGLTDVLLKFTSIFFGFWILSWLLTKVENLWSVPLIDFIYSHTPQKIKSLFNLHLSNPSQSR